MTKSNIYTISPAVPFLDSLAEGIINRFYSDSLSFTKALILLPNRRSCRAMQDSFIRCTKGKTILLPNIRPIGDADEDELSILSDITDIPPPISALRRKLLLAQIILKWQRQKEDKGGYNQEQAIFLAGELANFINDMQKEEVDFAGLSKIIPSEFAEHWQITLDFFNLLSHEWPSALKREGRIDPFEYKKALIHKQIDLWVDNPPQHPVIVAGTTASIPITLNLIEAAAELPQGYIVLPGLDMTCDSDYWSNIEENHPQYGLKRTIDRLKVDRKAVHNWNGNPEQNQDKEKFISELFRPATMLDGWMRGRVDYQPIRDISLIEAEDYQQESAAIAIRLREAAEKKQRAALVTNNRNIARTVSSAMKRWDINVNDSRGVPLSEIPQAVYLRLVNTMIAEKFSPVALLSVFKNPFAAGGFSIGEFRNSTRELEKRLLRGVRLYKEPEEIIEYLTGLKEYKLAEFFKKVLLKSKRFTSLFHGGTAKFSDILKVHISLCEELSDADGESGKKRLWSGPEGEELSEFISKLMEESKDMEVDLRLYPAILESILKSEIYRPAFGFNQELSILSPIEARLLSFDVVIIAGLNEDNWPRKQVSPWMSSQMRQDMGFESADRSIGLSAHDFVSLLSQSQVILSRSKKINGSLTVPSRWLLRLSTLLQANKLVIKECDNLIAWQQLLNMPASMISISPPSPKPPLSARPVRLSVTQVEKLMRNPYAVYINNILRLKELDDIDIDPGAADFGNILHNAFEYFTKNYKTGGVDEFISAGRHAFSKLYNIVAVRNIWWSRYINLTQSLINFESKRRESAVAIIAEDRGELDLALDAKLTARADRIEVIRGGTVSIIDYKTGTIPKKEDVESGLSPQLALEAIILLNGGFREAVRSISAKPKVVKMEYVKFLPYGDIEHRTFDDFAIIEQAESGLHKLINYFRSENIPYYSIVYTHDEKRYAKLNHLSRLDEWIDSL